MKRREFLSGAAVARFGLRRAPQRPHIVLLMADQYRADCMGADGNRIIQGYSRPEPFFAPISFARPHSPYDPAELKDLASDAAYEARVRLWRSRLIEHLAARGERFVKNGRLALRPDSHLYSPNNRGCSCHPPAKS